MNNQKISQWNWCFRYVKLWKRKFDRFVFLSLPSQLQCLLAKKRVQCWRIYVVSRQTRIMPWQTLICRRVTYLQLGTTVNHSFSKCLGQAVWSSIWRNWVVKKKISGHAFRPVSLSITARTESKKQLVLPMAFRWQLKRSFNDKVVQMFTTLDEAKCLNLLLPNIRPVSSWFIAGRSDGGSGQMVVDSVEIRRYRVDRLNLTWYCRY